MPSPYYPYMSDVSREEGVNFFFLSPRPPLKKKTGKKKNAWSQVKLGTETLAGRDVQVVQRPSSTSFPANGPQLSKSFILEDFAFR